MTYSIVYSSNTGNTRKLAETIKDCLDPADCIYFGEADAAALQADRIYAGFWTDKGTCDQATADFLKTLTNQEVFLFGTAGFGGNPDYFEKILGRVAGNLKTGKVIGTYMCQGKMPMSVRDRYEKMKSNPVHMPNLDQMIENFDRALTHPDSDDLAALRAKITTL